MTKLATGVALAVVLAMLMLASGFDRLWLIMGAMLCGMTRSHVMWWLEIK